MNDIVALYARVSMEETDSDSKRYQEPENQLVPLRQWAASQGWQVYKEYVDRASGADPNRKAFNEMLGAAMQHQFSTILVWRVDRFSRERMSTVLARIQQLQRRGVAVKSLTEGWFDTSKDNPIGEVILAIMAWASAEERRRISDRTKAGIQRLKNIGAWKGGRPKLLPAAIAAKVGVLAGSGLKADEIAKRLGLSKKDVRHWFKLEKKRVGGLPLPENTEGTNARFPQV